MRLPYEREGVSMKTDTPKLKVMTILGTRPEIIRLSRVMAELDSTCNHVLVHTGQNYDYELNQIFFEDLGVKKPDHYLKCVGDSAAQTIGNIIAAVDPILESEKPDAVLILGDTNSALAAIAAKRRKIPIFHMEAGNRCFDFRVPEEINRRIVDHLADINLPYSSIARDYLIAEGIPADRIIKTGSPMKEVLDFYADRIAASQVLSQLKLNAGNYFVVSAHREENVDPEPQIQSLVQSLIAVAHRYELPILFSTHPRTRKRLDEMTQNLSAADRQTWEKFVQLSKPLNLSDYVCLQKNAKAVLSDSGTINEEASILKLPIAINIREAHERPEAMEEASTWMTGLCPTRILQALAMAEHQQRTKTQMKAVHDYTIDNVSKKVVRILLSYTDYVNRVVWQK